MRFLSKISLIVFLVLSIASCRGTRDIYNPEGVAFPHPISSIQKVETVIIAAGNQRGWRMTKAGPGKMIGKVNVRNKHYATVEITYNTKSFNIHYKDSENLKYDAEKQQIHPNYNSWIQNLEQDILFQAQDIK